MASDATGMPPSAVYGRRFNADLKFRNEMWAILCKDFFQQFIPESANVLEIAAGYCEFINNIRAARKLAIDINKDTCKYAGKDVEVILTPSTDLSAIPANSLDVAFVSNFFEHINKTDITKTVQEVHRILKSRGRLMILQPNIRYLYKDYWMFYDHITPVDDRALCELLELVGFSLLVVRPKFLPYTTKSTLPRSLFLVRLYLRVPVLHWLFGGQAFIVAEKTQ